MMLYSYTRAFVALSLAIFITLGCAPNTVKELQAEVEPMVFTVDKYYEEVYEDVAFKLEGCATATAMGLHMFVQRRLSKEKQFGEVVIRSINMGDVGIWLQAKVHYQGPSLTKVEIWETNAGSWGKGKYIIKKWVLDDYQECHL